VHGTKRQTNVYSNDDVNGGVRHSNSEDAISPMVTYAITLTKNINSKLVFVVRVCPFPCITMFLGEYWEITYIVAKCTATARSKSFCPQWLPVPVLPPKLYFVCRLLV
jgi:hypothetical protein